MHRFGMLYSPHCLEAYMVHSVVLERSAEFLSVTLMISTLTTKMLLFLLVVGAVINEFEYYVKWHYKKSDYE